MDPRPGSLDLHRQQSYDIRFPERSNSRPALKPTIYVQILKTGIHYCTSAGIILARLNRRLLYNDTGTKNREGFGLNFKNNVMMRTEL